MRSFRLHNCVPTSRQQITAILLLVVIVVALLPIPVFTWLPANGKDRSRPFPCQDRPCGCRSADQCKKKCCCFSTEQKLAWAKRHGVNASEVVADASACKADASLARKSCCSTKKSQNARGAKPEIGSVARYQIVIGTMAQECQGLSHTYFGQTMYVIPARIELPAVFEQTGKRLVIASVSFEPHISEPPVPPPRIICA